MLGLKLIHVGKGAPGVFITQQSSSLWNPAQLFKGPDE